MPNSKILGDEWVAEAKKRKKVEMDLSQTQHQYTQVTNKVMHLQKEAEKESIRTQHLEMEYAKLRSIAMKGMIPRISVTTPERAWQRIKPDFGIPMGSEKKPLLDILVAPVATASLSHSPTFKWNNVDGALSYAIIIRDTSDNDVDSASSLKKTAWTTRQSLKTGRAYQWFVKVFFAHKPSIRSTIGWFWVSSPQTAKQFQSASLHLLRLGEVYEKALVFDSAESLYGLVPTNDPHYLEAVRHIKHLKAKRLRTKETPAHLSNMENDDTF